MDVQRGSVWQAVLEIKTQYNVYIEPRVSVSASGAITRYLDILSTDGTWNGLRLSIDKNMLSPAVTYDDSEVVTAMYGYGGTTTPTSASEEEKEITFADVVWTKTTTHPAKPAGQTYLEDPAATAAYGRNGRARFGYYQNTDILDPETLLQKTWETLQTASKPAISIDGTVADLYRMGYADEPIKLHDIALVEVAPAGYKAQLQIIRITTNLLDPTETTVTIGAYIPNIVYLERKNIEQITGSRGGGGGGSNKSKQTERSEYETQILKNNRMIQLRAYQNDLDDLDNEVKVQEAKLTVEHNRITAEVTDRREADNVLNASITIQANRITQEVTERKSGDSELSGRITVTAREIRQEVTDTENRLAARITVNADNIELKVDKSGVISAINVSPEAIDIQASKINLTGYVTASQLATTNATISNLTSGTTQAAKLWATVLQATGFTIGSNGRMTYLGHEITSHNATNRSGQNIAVLGWAQ